MNLKELKPGEKCRIIRIIGNSYFKKRLLEMGLIKGEIIKKEKNAPLGDPSEYIVKDYHISLRNSETEKIEVEIIE